jgi:hypothetical protein
MSRERERRFCSREKVKEQALLGHAPNARVV